MDRQKDFDVCLRLLQRVVAARGKDSSGLAQEYVWPAAANVAKPVAAMSLAPLLTGGGAALDAAATVPSHVVSVPPGLAPPKP